MNKLKLKRIDFDIYIWDCFSRLKEEDIRDGVYHLDSTSNRNPAQVADKIWIDLLIRHMETNNYN